MKRISRVAFLLLSWLPGMVLAQTADWVEGRITQAEAGEGIAHLTVELNQPDTVVRTDEQGYFSVLLPVNQAGVDLRVPSQRGYCEGKERLRVQKNPYDERRLKRSLPDLELIQSGLWQGWVVDHRNYPIGGAMLTWAPKQYTGSHSRGEFEIPLDKLAAFAAQDSICITVQRPGYHPQNLKVSVGCAAHRPAKIILKPRLWSRLKRSKAWVAGAGGGLLSLATVIYLFGGLPAPSHGGR